MATPDLQLIIDNTLFGYDEIKNLLLSHSDRDLSFQADDGDIKKAYITAYGDPQLSDIHWTRLANLFEVDAGKVKPKQYKGKKYSDIIYFPRQKSSTPSKTDIIKFQLAAGDPYVFKMLSQEVDESILAGASRLEEDITSGIETFFENYDSKNSLMRSRVEAVNRWKNITNYDEFLQIPLLKEGKDFMNKFLDIQDTIVAGGEVSLEDLEDLMPDYMRGGAGIYGGAGEEDLSLLDCVDPKYKRSSYILSEGISDVAKDLINRAFLASLSVIRISTLADLKNILAKINYIVKQMCARSNRLIDGGEKKKHTV